MRNSSVLPVFTSAPTSTLRSVMTPAKGARTFKIALQLGEPRDVGLRGGDVTLGCRYCAIECAYVGGLRLILRLILIVFLARHDAAVGEIVPARGGDLGERFVGLALFQSRRGALQIRLRLLYRGARLHNLLIQIRAPRFPPEVARR